MDGFNLMSEDTDTMDTLTDLHEGCDDLDGIFRPKVSTATHWNLKLYEMPVSTFSKP